MWIGALAINSTKSWAILFIVIKRGWLIRIIQILLGSLVLHLGLLDVLLLILHWSLLDYGLFHLFLIILYDFEVHRRRLWCRLWLIIKFDLFPTNLWQNIHISLTVGRWVSSTNRPCGVLFNDLIFLFPPIVRYFLRRV
jgi:hypothetical protein